METYIALLRGINVSGSKIIKMVDLREHLGELGYQNVQTYIQSGNVVFQCPPTDPKKLGTQIADKIRDVYGFEVPTLIRKATDLTEAMETNPYLKDEDNDQKKLMVLFLTDVPATDRIEHLASYSYPPEEYTIEGKTIFYHSPNGFAKAKMSTNFFESKLKVSASGRNLNTVRKLISMAEATS